jgi:hypothetical protein
MKPTFCNDAIYPEKQFTPLVLLARTDKYVYCTGIKEAEVQRLVCRFYFHDQKPSPVAPHLTERRSARAPDPPSLAPTLHHEPVE